MVHSQLPAVNISGDFEETVLQWARHLGRDKNRRAVFNLIYGRGTRPRSKKQIAEALQVGGTAQVVQNALDELAKYHLIVRVPNDGKVDDGSRWLYGKDNSVRAHRDRIVRLADNPSAAKLIPTKRRPAAIGGFSLVETPIVKGQKRTGGAQTSRQKAKIKIALLITNPELTAVLQTGLEARKIVEGIRLSGNSNKVDINHVLAPTLDTLLDVLNTYCPDIIHFSGHGGGQALVFDNENAGDDGGTILSFDLVARVIEATRAKPKLIVFAACDTVRGAERFLNSIPAIVAMSDKIGDAAACNFSKRFYQSLIGGATIANALEQARIGLEVKGDQDADLPTLLANDRRSREFTFI